MRDMMADILKGVGVEMPEEDPQTVEPVHWWELIEPEEVSLLVISPFLDEDILHFYGVL